MRRRGEPPAPLPKKTQCSQAPACVFVCVWPRPQQTLPFHDSGFDISGSTGSLLYWVGALRQQQFTKMPRLSPVFPLLTFLTIVSPVHFTLEGGSGEGLWRLLADVYVCAVLICSLGLLSIFLFTLVLTCQYFYRRHRLKASYLLVKCPESSSGETVTSSGSSSSSSPRAQRRETRPKRDIKTTIKPPKVPEEPPPHIPAKVPVAAKRPQKPRRLKAPPRRTANPRWQEDSLTYAELELVRPKLEPLASSGPEPTPSSPDTVYAQILFQEKQL